MVGLVDYEKWLVVFDGLVVFDEDFFDYVGFV